VATAALALSARVLLGVEGLIWIAVAAPPAAAAFFAGRWLGARAAGAAPSLAARVAAAAIAVALVPAARALEGMAPAERRLSTVTTSMVVPAPAAETWEAIKSYDGLRGRRPWLMSVGLPEPTRCTLEREAVGARRTCHFDVGRIEERVVAWEPPRRMELEIEETALPGRRFLTFTRATYELSEGEGGTRVTRTTVLASTLRPAWYFGPLERLGVGAEHEYLLRSVVQRLAR
jgi:uncharacterized protein YndB with AHSA1/START domain